MCATPGLYNHYCPMARTTLKLIIKIWHSAICIAEQIYMYVCMCPVLIPIHMSKTVFNAELNLHRWTDGQRNAQMETKVIAVTIFYGLYLKANQTLRNS